MAAGILQQVQDERMWGRLSKEAKGHHPRLRGMTAIGFRFGPGVFIPLILNLLKDGHPLFRPLLPFPPPFPSFNKFRMSGIGISTVIPA